MNEVNVNLLVEEYEKEKLRRALEKIPAEIWINVFCSVEASHLLVCRLVCKNWLRIINDQLFWKSKYKRDLQMRSSKMFVLPADPNWMILYFDHRNKIIEYDNRKHLRKETMTKMRRAVQEAEEMRAKVLTSYLQLNPQIPRVCRRCNSQYVESTNLETSCTYHPLSYNRLIEEWRCCTNKDKRVSGCATSRHSPSLNNCVLNNVPTDNIFSNSSSNSNNSSTNNLASNSDHSDEDHDVVDDFIENHNSINNPHNVDDTNYNDENNNYDNSNYEHQCDDCSHLDSSHAQKYSNLDGKNDIHGCYFDGEPVKWRYNAVTEESDDEFTILFKKSLRKK